MEQAVLAAYAASVAAGQPLSQRAMAERFSLSRRKVSQLVASVSVESNGHLLAGAEPYSWTKATASCGVA